MKTLILMTLTILSSLASAEVGMIKFYNESKGFGFITPYDGTNDCLLLKKNIFQEDLPKISHGLCVNFEAVYEDRKCTALDVSLIECP